MASFCWLSTGNPGLLGQLILATVATQAARNSDSALGCTAKGVVGVDVVGLVVEQAANRSIIQPPKSLFISKNIKGCGIG